jgi:carboxypeptidase Taq
LPHLWRQKVKDYFGLQVPTDGQGALQDIHWAFGAFGYFPTYTLGNLYAAQFYAQAQKSLGDLSAQIERGEFRPLLDWLRVQIHGRGSLLLPAELCRKICGEDLNIQYFLDYLNRKFGEIYAI